MGLPLSLGGAAEAAASRYDRRLPVKPFASATGGADQACAQKEQGSRLRDLATSTGVREYEHVIVIITVATTDKILETYKCAFGNRTGTIPVFNAGMDEQVSVQ